MKGLRIAKLGKNAFTSTSPNDFIFNSDYNTPSIIKQADTTPTLGVGNTTTDLAHGLNYTPFSIGFVKFEDGRVGLIGTKAAGVNFFSTSLKVNATNVRFGTSNQTGSDYSPTFKYLATEMPLAGTPNIALVGGRRLVIAKPGKNVFTETNPNNLIFDSRWGSLKYFDEGITEIILPSYTSVANVLRVDETVLATHGLEFYPFFGANYEFSGIDPGKAFIMPLMFADAGFETYRMIYTTTTQLIYRNERRDAFGGSTPPAQTIKVYWKIYSRNLGL